MTVKDILRPNPAYRRGLVIDTISETSLDPIGCEFLTKLKTIPPKLSAQLHRHLIQTAYKTKFFQGNPDLTYYIVVATDGTVFHVDY